MMPCEKQSIFSDSAAQGLKSDDGLRWPELESLATREQLKAFACSEQLPRHPDWREPRHPEKARGWANLVVAQLSALHVEDTRPEHHPADVCGACGQPMPYRPPGQPSTHSCKTCGKPIHGAAFPGCSCIVRGRNNELFFCNKTCAGAQKRRSHLHQ